LQLHCQAFGAKFNQRMMKKGNSPKKRASNGLLEKAIRIAVDAHAGQKDKSGQSYIHIR
jgi:hypothetical protein